MKEKLYIINGGGLRWLNQSTFVTNLKQFYNVIDIGNHDTGLDYAKFSEYFIDQIEPTTENLNIILNTHGQVLNGQYMLGVSKLPVKKPLKTVYCEESVDKTISIINYLAKSVNWQELQDSMLTARKVISIWGKTNNHINLEKLTTLAREFMNSLSLLLEGQDFEDISVEVFNTLSYALSFSQHQDISKTTDSIVTKLDEQLFFLLNETIGKATNFVSYIAAETEASVTIIITLEDILTKLVNLYKLDRENLSIMDKSLDKSLGIMNDHLEILPKEAIDFVQNLVAATKGLPLNIISLSCFGANLQSCLPLLPKESILITLSDIDVPTEMMNFEHDNMQYMFQNVMSGAVKFENLLKVYCMVQRFSQSAPSIGVVNKDGSTKTISLSVFAEKFIEHSTEAELSLLIEGVASELLIEKIKSGTSVESFKIPATLLRLDTILEHMKHETMPALKIEWQKYYEPKVLDGLIFNLINYQATEKREIQKLDIKQKLKNKLLNLQEQTNVLLPDEIDLKISNALQIMLDSQSTIEERSLAEEQYQKLIKQLSVSNKLHHMEDSIAFTTLHYTALPTKHYPEISNFQSDYNKLLVLGAEYLIQHIGDIIENNTEF